MQIHIAPDYDQMSEQSVRAFLTALEGRTAPLVLLPSGKSPVGMLKGLREHFLAKGTRPDWHFIGLDEWVGIGQEVFGSCREFLDRHLFKPLGIPEAQIHFFNGVATNLDAERARAEALVAQHGRIVISVLGIGTNGHLGLNEPGSDPELRSQVTTLAPSTIAAAKDYFDGPQTVTQGITLGLKTLLESEHVFLLASGRGKAEIIRQTVEGPVTRDVPASFLQSHTGCQLFLDTDAASALTT